MKPMLALVTLAFAFFGSHPAPAADTVVARIGDRDVTASEIRGQLEELTPKDREALQANRAELARFVRGILVRRALLQDATAAGWEKNPSVVAGLNRVRDQYLVESFLQSAAKVPEDYPSDEEVASAYKAEKERLRLPRRFQLSQIFISADGGDEAARKKAESLAAQVKAKPADFARLAKENSDEPVSAARNGSLGWLAEEAITPEVRPTVSTLAKGQVSAPVKGNGGYHIIRLEDVREAGPASIEEVREDLKTALRLQRAQLNREAYIATLLERQAISVNELALDALADKPKE